MNDFLFSELLIRCESDDLDFKMEQYDLDGNDKPTKDIKRAKFVKDIISIANTPRTGNGYIILGVNKHVDNTFDLVGIDKHYDDAMLQDKIKDLVYPIPTFNYESFCYNALTFGIITIPIDINKGPFFPRVDVGGDLLRRNQLYFRRSSQNSEANHADQGIPGTGIPGEFRGHHT